jgi:hypothetical protein
VRESPLSFLSCAPTHSSVVWFVCVCVCVFLWQFLYYPQTAIIGSLMTSIALHEWWIVDAYCNETIELQIWGNLCIWYPSSECWAELGFFSIFPSWSDNHPQENLAMVYESFKIKVSLYTYSWNIFTYGTYH